VLRELNRSDGENEDSDALHLKIVAELNRIHSLGKETGAVYVKNQRRFLKRLQTMSKTPNQALDNFIKMNVAIGKYCFDSFVKL